MDRIADAEQNDRTKGLEQEVRRLRRALGRAYAWLVLPVILSSFMLTCTVSAIVRARADDQFSRAWTKAAIELTNCVVDLIAAQARQRDEHFERMPSTQSETFRDGRGIGRTSFGALGHVIWTTADGRDVDLSVQAQAPGSR